MPINWGPLAHEKLLLKMLETHPDITIDVVKVAESWPDPDDANQPTPWVIGDHLRKLKRGAGIKTPLKLSGTRAKLARTIRVKDEFDDASTPATRTPTSKKLKFIRSSFSTSFRTTEMKSKDTDSKIRHKKRKIDDTSDEEEAMSSSGSESEADAVPEQESSTRSSKRRRTTNPKYNLKDIQTSTDDGADDGADDEEERQASDEGDGGYNPMLEYEEEKAKREKRGRPHKARRLGEEDAEKA